MLGIGVELGAKGLCGGSRGRQDGALICLNIFLWVMGLLCSWVKYKQSFGEEEKGLSLIC